jgi:hypothetical protein
MRHDRKQVKSHKINCILLASKQEKNPLYIKRISYFVAIAMGAVFNKGVNLNPATCYGDEDKATTSLAVIYVVVLGAIEALGVVF